jgi:hypothetical protein
VQHMAQLLQINTFLSHISKLTVDNKGQKYKLIKKDFGITSHEVGKTFSN